LGRKKIPITVNIGEPLFAADTVDQAQAALELITRLLHETQESYPHPAAAYWVPLRLGGGAPTPGEATALDQAELAERARKRAERDETTLNRAPLCRRHRRVATAPDDTGELRPRIAPYDTCEQPKRIA
jgi:hypothetical protein